MTILYASLGCAPVGARRAETISYALPGIDVLRAAARLRAHTSERLGASSFSIEGVRETEEVIVRGATAEQAHVIGELLAQMVRTREPQVEPVGLRYVHARDAARQVNDWIAGHMGRGRARVQVDCRMDMVYIISRDGESLAKARALLEELDKAPGAPD